MATPQIQPLLNNQTMRYAIEVARDQGDVVTMELASVGYRTHSEYYFGPTTILIYVVGQPSDFYIHLHNLLRRGAISSYGAEVEQEA